MALVPATQASVGWPLKLAREIGIAQAPTSDQLAVLRAVDPAGMILEGSRSRERLASIDEYVEVTLRNIPKGRP